VADNSSSSVLKTLADTFIGIGARKMPYENYEPVTRPMHDIFHANRYMAAKAVRCKNLTPNL
jgi:hypothetical protein